MEKNLNQKQKDGTGCIAGGVSGIFRKSRGCGSTDRKEEIVIEIDRERFTFTGIEVTQPHSFEWKTQKESVYLSGVGMLAEDNTEVEEYISNLIGTPKDTEDIATVYYKDGKQVSWQLSFPWGI